MQGAVTKLFDFNKLEKAESESSCVGQIVQITEQGEALVDYPGNPKGPVKARLVIDALSLPHNPADGSIPVLLFFEKSDPALPIIVGIIRETLYPPPPPRPLEEVISPIERPRKVTIDDRKMVLDAKEEIVFRCGKSCVKLRKDGKIIVKGVQIVSRASGTNKIKGASIRIN